MTYTPHQAVIQAASEVFEIGPKDLLGHSRIHDIAHARQAAVYAMRQLRAGMSTGMIGRLFDRDRATVIHAERVTQERIDADDAFAGKVDQMVVRAQELCAPAVMFGPRGNPEFKTRRTSV